MAVKREIREVEKQLEVAQDEFSAVSQKLKQVSQQRINMEEELMASNVRLKQLLGELKAQKERSAENGAGGGADSTMTLAELSRKVESSLMRVLEERFNDEAFTAAISEQSSLSTADKVRVEYEGDEAYWSLQDNYNFEALLQDAARYWDISPQDAVLQDGGRKPASPPAPPALARTSERSVPRPSRGRTRSRPVARASQSAAPSGRTMPTLG
jgi:hypothetical protein